MSPGQLQNLDHLALPQTPVEPKQEPSPSASASPEPEPEPERFKREGAPSPEPRPAPARPRIILHHNPNREEERGIIIERIGNTRRIRVTIKEEVLRRKGLKNPFKRE
jgi:hypothetical protein